MSSTAELAIVYAALILHDDKIAVTPEKLLALTEAAGVTVEPIWATIFAKALEGKSIDDYIKAVNAGAAAAPVAAAAAPAAAKAAPAAQGKAAKKEEPKEESDEEMGFGLFD